MKKHSYLLLLLFAMLWSGCGTKPESPAPDNTPVVCKTHTDEDGNNLCDQCKTSVLVYVDFYAMNDLHGKFNDGETHPGVDELTTYLKNAKASPSAREKNTC